MRIFEPPLAPQSGIGRVIVAVLIAVVATIALLAWSPANAFDSEAQKTESPYFQVASSDASTDRLPLKSTQVDVRIAGVIADVTVTQHYRNEGQRPIEARDVFPGSTAAAVYAMNVRLGERFLVAKISEKQQARIEYETARQEARVLQLYLAVVPWGDGQCGGEAAALHYFGKHAASLDGVEAVWLASLLRNPEAELDRAAAHGLDAPRLASLAEALRPMSRTRREDLQAELVVWSLPPVVLLRGERPALAVAASSPEGESRSATRAHRSALRSPG
jgi:hypothetical protein